MTERITWFIYVTLTNTIFIPLLLHLFIHSFRKLPTYTATTKQRQERYCPLLLPYFRTYPLRFALHLSNSN